MKPELQMSFRSSALLLSFEDFSVLVTAVTNRRANATDWLIVEAACLWIADSPSPDLLLLESEQKKNSMFSFGLYSGDPAL